jgi:YesN/AraC family two-component response regulator
VNRIHISRSGKYLKQLLLTIAVSLVAIVVIVSSVLYYGAEKAMVDLNLKGNQKVLSQLKFNIDYMNENLKNVLMTQYFDNRNYPLMYAEQIVPFEMLSRLRNLDRFVVSSPSLHSIVMYNAIQNKYYTGGRIEMSPENDSILAEIDRYIKENRDIPKLQLIPMRGKGRQEEGKPEVDVFSMFMYESNASNSLQKSMLIVNIQPEWLFDNLNLLNRFIDNESGTIGIMDESGNIFYPTEASLQLQLDFKTRVMQQIRSNGGDSGQFIERDGGVRQVVTYMSTGLNEWKMIIVQPYWSLVDWINELRLMALMIIACFVLFAIVCSIIVSFRLYRPIQRLLGHIRPVPNMDKESLQDEPSNRKDELHYIECAYNGMLTSLQTVKRDYDENRLIVRSYYARTLLLESHSLSKSGFEQLIGEQRLRIAQRGVYRLFMLQIDKAALFRESFNMTEQKLLQFAVRNIAEHVLSSTMQVETIEAKVDLTVLLLSSENEKELDEAAVVPLAKRIQEVVLSYYRLSLTIALGDANPDYRSLSESYAELQDMCLYRMISGHGSVITAGMIQQNSSDHDLKMLDDLDKKLAEAIRMNHKMQAEEHLAAAFGLLRMLPTDQMMHSLLTMLSGIRNALGEVNKNRLQVIYIGWNQYIREVTELETLADAHTLFTRLLAEIADKQSDQQQNKHLALVDTIKEMIETRYADLNLSLQTIADSLGMTAAYISRVFRKAESLAVHDYIREIRLKHSLSLLERCDSPIGDIMDRVGYGNVSNFFRHFKKQYGSTPNEYRLKRSIENNGK